MKDQNADRPETYPAEDFRLEPQTTASESHPQRHCRQCKQPIRDRKQNYCSDACRMRDKRGNDRRKWLELLDTISAAVNELREVLR
jgi:predicted nucleic acid-binding Zn ribbon protein